MDQPNRRLRYQVASSLDGFIASPNGDGELFRTLLEARLVDTVEPAIIPVLLGSGIPLLPPPAQQTTLRLTKHRLYPKSGIMLLDYAVT